MTRHGTAQLPDRTIMAPARDGEKGPADTKTTTSVGSARETDTGRTGNMWPTSPSPGRPRTPPYSVRGRPSPRLIDVFDFNARVQRVQRITVIVAIDVLDQTSSTRRDRRTDNRWWNPCV
ncbi:hypothetical protein GCM10017557_75120 [Streptomyces aurantiacus]|uniref:Uncharacterized protein n=1 Tax=Streptomyces aurantiacus TaxID=47760 RepID=A0A7G1PAF3_9ACTN|nr:hypothetical protein GCM10017557_75120 [Streptomyces aurantiacus]